MAEKFVFVGVLPETVSLESGEQAIWVSNAGNLKIEFDANRCPFGSNIFQAPMNVQIGSGPVRAGTNPGGYKYRVFLNEIASGQGEVIVRAKNA